MPCRCRRAEPRGILNSPADSPTRAASTTPASTSIATRDPYASIATHDPFFAPNVCSTATINSTAGAPTLEFGGAFSFKFSFWSIRRGG